MDLSVIQNINYFFKNKIKTGYQKIIIRPRNSNFQKILKWDVKIDGGVLETSSVDQFRNNVDIIRLKDNISSIHYKITGLVKTRNSKASSKTLKNDLPLWCFKNISKLTYPGKKIKKFNKNLKLNRNDPINSIMELINEIRSVVKYKKGKTNYKTTAEESLIKGYGVCQDHTHIFLSLLRLNNIACRYISGYLLPIKATKNLSMHAWAEVYLQDIGWVSFDVSNGIKPNERYIVIGKGFDYDDVTPLKGIINSYSKEKLDTNLIIKLISQ